MASKSKATIENELRLYLAEIKELEELLIEQVSYEISINKTTLKASNITKYKINMLNRKINTVLARWNRKVMSWEVWKNNSVRMNGELTTRNQELEELAQEIADIDQRISLAEANKNLESAIMLFGERNKLTNTREKLRRRVSQLRVMLIEHETKKPIAVAELNYDSAVLASKNKQAIDKTKKSNPVDDEIVRIVRNKIESDIMPIRREAKSVEELFAEQNKFDLKTSPSGDSSLQEQQNEQSNTEFVGEDKTKENTNE